MFGRLKKWMGIEGAKLRLHILPSYPLDVNTINGEIEIYSQSPQKVLSVQIKFYELYSRGKGEEKRIDEFLLGTWLLNEPFLIDEKKPKIQFFKLEFEKMNSNMDKIANKGIVRKGLVRFAKSMKGISSDYRIEAEAEVAGLNWKPFAKSKVVFQ